MLVRVQGAMFIYESTVIEGKAFCLWFANFWERIVIMTLNKKYCKLICFYGCVCVCERERESKNEESYYKIMVGQLGTYRNSQTHLQL